MKAIDRLIDYFAHNHLLINLIFFATIAGGVYYWTVTGKEALPSVDFNFVRVSVSYPGASAGDVEYFITRPLEDVLKSLEGVHRVRSTSSSGSSSLLVEIQNTAELPIVVNDIEAAVRGVSLPSEVRDLPQVRQFKTSQRAILDVALIDTEKHLLDYESRSSLQDYALALENRLNSLTAVNTVSKSGYLKKQLKIEVLPEKLQRYDITISSIQNKLNSYDLKQPLGKLEDSNESEVVVADTDYSPEEIKKTVLRGTYLNPEVRLGDVARIYRDFEENRSITKINGHEAIVLNINKTASYGILKAVEEVKVQVDSFQNGNPNIELVYLDDESVEVQNRITLIKNNGIIGFSIIIVLLFLFLDFTSGFWVAMGILFTFPFTMIVAHFLGYTINNVTLAGVIIVMGMIVDDAIVISENIVRKKREGLPRYQAVVEGTSQMLLPVTASVITTCIAFMPMLAMEGRFSQFASPIPAIVIIMLVASLLESVFLLPGHMNYSLPPRLKGWLSFFSKRPRMPKPRDWFSRVEDVYRDSLLRILRFRYLILLLFSGMLALAGYHLVKNMNFVMFPNEESTTVFLRGKAPSGSTQVQTADLSQKAEEIFRRYPEEVMNFRTDIGRSRRGRQVEENEFTLLVEIVPKEKREKPLNQLIQEWEEAFKEIPELEVKVFRHRFGRGSGETPIEIVVLDDNDASREGVLESLREVMANDPALRQVEIDKQNVNEGFAVKVKRSFLELTGLEGKNLISTLRTILNGQVIKEIPEDNEKVNLILSVPELAKTEVPQVLDFSVGLNNGNNVPLSLFVDTVPSPIPTAIYRERYRRVGRIYADIQDFSEPSPGDASSHQRSLRGTQSNQNRSGSPDRLGEDKTGKGSRSDQGPVKQAPEGFVVQTPLQIAERYEKEVLPIINARYPNAIVYFDGEVRESRESQSSFLIAFVVVLLAMYMILALLFRSLLKPLIVMAIIPFGLVGVMLAFYLQGIGNYGFFALLGFLGLSGVVVNDTIVMLSRFEVKRKDLHKENLLAEVAEIAQTRLRAIIMTTVSTVAGLFPTIYGWAGYDSLLAEMMFVMAWGLVFATLITLVLLPSLYCIFIGWQLTHPQVEEEYSLTP